MPVQPCVRDLDRAVAALAGRQHGVISYRQLLALGLTRNAVLTRVAAWRLHPLHRGVYAVMPPKLLRVQGHWMAAVLAIGEDAVISHRSAAAHWGLLTYGGARIDVTVPRRLDRRPGLSLHCRRSLPDHHMTIKDSIPVTTVARTIADLAAAVPERLVERALGQAEVLRIYDARAMGEILEAQPHRPGAPLLRHLLALPSSPASRLSRSDLEEALLALCDAHAIRSPELNAPFTLPDGTPIEIDALWGDERLALEVDSERWHSDWRKQVSDRNRDRQLLLAGMRPVRVVDDDVLKHASRTASMLRALLEVDDHPPTSQEFDAQRRK